MNRTAKIAITIVIGVALVATASAFAYTTMMSSQTSDSPLSYIPSNSSLVMWVDYNGTSLYLFHSNNSTAVLLNTVGVKSGNLSFTSGNSSYSLPLKYNSTYGGFEIYSINVSSALSGLLKLNSSLSPMLNLTNVPLYVFVTENGKVVLGTMSGVKSSINSFNKGSNFVSKGSYLNQSDNISFYYSPTNNTIPFKYAWGGINGTSFYAYAELKNSTAFNFTGSFTYQGFSVKSISPNEIEITYEFGSLSQLYSKLDSMR